jgi:hypothetical protein
VVRLAAAHRDVAVCLEVPGQGDLAHFFQGGEVSLAPPVVLWGQSLVSRYRARGNGFSARGGGDPEPAVLGARRLLA